MKHLLEYLHAKNPKQVIVATLFHKPKAAVCQVPIAYKGIELENDFVVGRGLDYDGFYEFCRLCKNLLPEWCRRTGIRPFTPG